MKRRGWFVIPGEQDGDRTVSQQMRGLGPLVERVRGARVVDFGCAEGLIDKALLDHGAAHVRGYEVVADHIVVANRVCAAYRQEPPQAHFIVRNLNETAAICGDGTAWDEALMLAVLHKLKRPADFLVQVIAQFAPRRLVIRTAKATPGYVDDSRADKGHRVVKLLEFLPSCGYAFKEKQDGPFDEWTGYFEKEEH